MTGDSMKTPRPSPRDEASRGVIWDVDGTLIDSGPLHFAAWTATLAQEQFKLTPERFRSSFGQRNDAVLRGFLGSELAQARIVEIAAAKEERYRNLLREKGIELLPGVRSWLERLLRTGWRQAIASSAPHANLDAILDVLSLRPFFGAVISGDDVTHGKPDPEIFLRAAEGLDVEPGRCVVVEDAPAGLEGAARAGMYSVGVLFAHQELRADLVVSTLDDLPADAFDRLVPASL